MSTETHNGLAFVFPGQGSQALGMLADLAAAHPEIEAAFREASEGAGRDLWALAQQGPLAALDHTENTQPVLLAAGVAVWRAWQAAGGATPVMLAGHSLGEYSALVCSGVLSLFDAAGLVAERGRLMQEAVPDGVGAMAAVLGGDDKVIADVCDAVAEGEVVAPANYNAPGQVVIAGHKAAVDRALAALAEHGVRKAVKLAVSVPSHTVLMREAAERLADRMEGLAWHEPTLPVLQNVDADVHGSVAHIRAALVRQLYMPVRWSESMTRMVHGGITEIAECGPGKVLCGLMKRIDRAVTARPLGTVGDFDAALAAWSSSPATN